MDSLESYYEYKNTTFRERIVGKKLSKESSLLSLWGWHHEA